jgi:hypothetical protein
MKDKTLTIYPTTLKVTDHLIRLSRAGAALGFRVTTLPQIADALWRETFDRRSPLSDVGQRLLIIEAMAPVTSNRPSLRAERILALVNQVKSAGLSGTDWRTAYRALSPSEQATLEFFTEVFERYEGLLAARQLADRHDREGAVVGLLHRLEQEGRRPEYLEGVERLVVAEIYDLSLLQFMTVAALIRLVGDAQLRIQAESHRADLSRFTDLTWNRFAGEESVANQVLPEFVRRSGRPGRLGFVLEHLFTGIYPAPPAPDPTVSVVAEPHPQGEALAAARAVRRLLEENRDLPLERIAIVARDLALYRDYLEAAFRRYRVPLALEMDAPVQTVSLARTLLQLVSIPLEAYRRDALLALCATPHAALPVAAYRSLPIETGYLDASMRSLADCCELRRQELLSADRPASPERLEWLRRGASTWQALLDAVATLESPATLADHALRLTALLARLGFAPPASLMPGPGAAGIAAVWRTLDELASEAARVVPQRTITLRDFRATLEAVLSIATVSAKSASGAVRGLPLRDARGLDFDRLFILGLNDGVFPRYHPLDPLVPDSSANLLNRALRGCLARRFGDRRPAAPGAILRTRAQRNSEEPFLFFLALSMPEQAVVLSYSVEDESGRPLARSPFLDEVARLLGLEGALGTEGGSDPRRTDSLDERDFLNQAAAGGTLGTLSAIANFDAERLQSIVKRIEIEAHRSHYLALPSREELFAARRRGGKSRQRGRNQEDDRASLFAVAINRDVIKTAAAGSYDGRLAAGSLISRLLGDSGRPYHWSAGQLTELASCGFKFFAHRVLRLEDDAEMDHATSRLESGELTHQLLSEYFAANPDFDRPDAAIALAEEIAERIHRRARGGARDPAFFDLNWVVVTAMLEEVVRYEIAGYAPPPPGVASPQIFHEFDFDFALTSPGCDSAAERAGAAAPIVVRGRIDRLELHRGAAGLIERLSAKDYKSSRDLNHLAAILRPGTFATSDLQMPVYLLAAVERFRHELASGATVQASYLALRNREKETAPLEVPLPLLDPALGGQPGNVAQRIRELVDEARSGHFDVDPLECADWCPYRPVCRFTKRAAP